MRSIAEVIARVRAEFLEMPGLCLTVPQAQRLCGLERTVCDLVLEELVDAKFLRVSPDGAYRRATEGGMAARRVLSRAERRSGASG